MSAGREVDTGSKWRVSFYVRLMVHVEVDAVTTDLGNSGTEEQRAIDLAQEYVDHNMDFGKGILLNAEADLAKHLGNFEVPLDEAESKVIDD